MLIQIYTDSDPHSFICFLHIDVINKTNIFKNKNVENGKLPLRLNCRGVEATHKYLKKRKKYNKFNLGESGTIE